MRRMRASVVGLVVAAIAFACDSSPTAPPTAPPTLSNRGALASLTSQLKGSTKSTGLIACSQTYDSVTQAIGPLGGLIAVGPHYLFVDSLALTSTVSITAVAPAGTVDRKSTRLNSSHSQISYAVFCLKKKITKTTNCTIDESR